MKVPYALEVPNSTDTVIVFPWNNRANYFERDFYVPGMTDYKASFEQIEQYLDEADQIARQRIRKVRRIYCLFIAATVALLGSVLTILITTKDPFGTKMGFMLGWVLLTMAFCVFVSKYIKRRFITLKDEIDKLSRSYYPVFEKTGLHWNFVIHYPGWLELEKRYKMEPGYVQPNSDLTHSTIIEMKHDWSRQGGQEYQHLKN